MRPGQHRSSWRFRFLFALPLLLAAGCVVTGPRVATELMADRDPAAHDGDRGALYLVHCPDLLDVEAPERLDDAARPVGADGCIPLADGVRLYVDGLTAPEIARAAADRLGLPADQVRVGVIEYNSQELYLFGEVAGQERAVPVSGTGNDTRLAPARRRRRAGRGGWQHSDRARSMSPTASRRNFSRSISLPSSTAIRKPTSA